MVLARAGSKLLKKGAGAAKRYWDDATGTPKKVRASKGTAVQAGGQGSAKGRKAGAKQQNKPAAQKQRKAEGKIATDLKQPARGSVGETAEGSDAGIASFKTASFTTKKWDKALKKKEADLEKYKKKRDSLKGKDKLKFIVKNTQRVKDLKASIADMKRREGPRIKRKTGGQVTEEARSGTMSEKKRATHMKRGGRVNTSRENRLEELGRVDAEKAHTKKGKRNLRQEKKRIVRELNGNDFVAQHYD